MTPWTNRDDQKKPPTLKARQTAIDITAEDLEPRLSSENVSDLVLISMVNLFFLCHSVMFNQQLSCFVTHVLITVHSQSFCSSQPVLAQIACKRLLFFNQFLHYCCFVHQTGIEGINMYIISISTRKYRKSNCGSEYSWPVTVTCCFYSPRLNNPIIYHRIK